MDAVTYPQQAVQQALADFALFKVNMMERHPDFKAASSGGRVIWGPTFIVHDARGSEVRRWTGWLPADAFVAELAFCRAMADYNRGDFAGAEQSFAGLIETAAGTPIHPEVLYWHGAAGFIAGKQDWSALRLSWERLVADYPGHRYAIHASVIEDAATG